MRIDSVRGSRGVRVIGAAGAVAVLAGVVAAGPAAADAAAHGAKGEARAQAQAQIQAQARVQGSGQISYAYSPDDTIKFTVDAKAAPFTRPMPGLSLPGLPTDATGTVKFSHASEGRKTGWSRARVDCMVTGGGTATLTAIVTKSNVEKVGKRFGLSVQQGRGGEPDRLGFGWDIVNFEPRKTDKKGNAVEPRVGTCMAPAPFAPVVKGGFDVVHADLPPLPASVAGVAGAAGAARRG
ncbi:hypothetical protein [Streptomyces formicae]|uniref:Uncharacterized protein n=1 Tax=Streptomyces formicae TaxID=1616117 RepID=A0A291QBW9_9ACTN|nr:hypothetical protein [Streptomyces formicae]ATL28963.1 hypothetical protein KY5_3945c [Streptomyces formicae]